MKSSWDAMAKGKAGAWVAKRDFERLKALQAKLEETRPPIQPDLLDGEAFGIREPKEKQ